MSSAKEDILKMIQAKRDKIRNARRRIVRQEDVYNTVVDFVKDMDKATKESKSYVDFNGYLNEAARKLNTGVCRLDPTAHVRIAWNKDEDLDEKWNELQVDYVVINWSEHFSKKTGRNKEETVDIGHLFLEGYFS
jgi:hypothetical protein